MADKIGLLLEAEKRGILPDDKKALLGEARKRGLIKGNTSEKVEKNSGFFQSVHEDAQSREHNIQKVGQYGETAPEKGLQKLGQAAGFTGDVVAEGVKSAAGAIPQGIKDELASGMENLHDDPVYKNTLGALVDFGVKTLQKGGAGWDKFRDAHPRIARDIEGAANLGFFALPGAKGTEAAIEGTAAVAKAAPEALEAAGEGIKTAGKAVVPKVDEGLKDTALLARQYDIPLSYDQITSSNAVKNAQKVSQELPFSGQAGFRDKQLSAWNNRVLKTVGVEGDKFTKENMDKAFTQVGKEFDDLGKGQTYNLLDDDFITKIDGLKNEAKDIANKDAIDNFESVVGKALKEADQQGNITGEKLGKIRSEVNRLARKTSNYDTKELLHDFENTIIDKMTENAPGFSETKRKYKNLLVIEPLAAKAKAGNISPSLLNNRVYRIYGREHVRGNAGEIGDLAQIGFELLPELGGSDTLPKAMIAKIAGAGVATTGAAMNAPLTGTGLAINRAVQSGVNRNQKIIDAALKSKK